MTKYQLLVGNLLRLGSLESLDRLSKAYLLKSTRTPCLFWVLNLKLATLFLTCCNFSAKNSLTFLLLVLLIIVLVDLLICCLRNFKLAAWFKLLACISLLFLLKTVSSFCLFELLILIPLAKKKLILGLNTTAAAYPHSTKKEREAKKLEIMYHLTFFIFFLPFPLSCIICLFYSSGRYVAAVDSSWASTVAFTTADPLWKVQVYPLQLVSHFRFFPLLSPLTGLKRKWDKIVKIGQTWKLDKIVQIGRKLNKNWKLDKNWKFNKLKKTGKIGQNWQIAREEKYRSVEARCDARA